MQSTNGQAFTLTFDSFDVGWDSNCLQRDYVEVNDGKGFVWNQQYCGASIPGPFTSTGAAMTVRMQTDGSVTKPGFSAVWKSIMTQSGKIIFPFI